MVVLKVDKLVAQKAERMDAVSDMHLAGLTVNHLVDLKVVVLVMTTAGQLVQKLVDL
jgi:hypothetical protein